MRWLTAMPSGFGSYLPPSSFGSDMSADFMGLWSPAWSLLLSTPASIQRGLHRPRSGVGGPDRRPGQGPRHQGQEGPVPLGGGMVGTHAGDMIGEIALAIEMGADAVDIGKTIHPHPTLGESIGMAAEVAHGSCTDLPPVRK